MYLNLLQCRQKVTHHLTSRHTGEDHFLSYACFRWGTYLEGSLGPMIPWCCRSGLLKLPDVCVPSHYRKWFVGVYWSSKYLWDGNTQRLWKDWKKILSNLQEFRMKYFKALLSNRNDWKKESKIFNIVKRLSLYFINWSDYLIVEFSFLKDGFC